LGNIVDFKKVVKIATLTNEGVFSVTIDNLTDVSIHECSIYLWFHEGRLDGRPWDLSLEYGSPQEAQDSFDEMADAIREIRFKEFNVSNECKIYKIHKEDEPQ